MKSPRDWSIRARLMLAFVGVLLPYLGLAGLGAVAFHAVVHDATARDLASDVVRRIAVAGIGIVLLSVAGGIGLALTFSAWLAGPIRAIAETSRRIAGGDLSRRVDARAGGEVGEAARAFNEMADRLLEVDRMKTDFVSFVTHQLRTPLTGIKWLLELAAEDRSLPPETASSVEDARQAAERLITLVNDLLDVARLESGRIAVEPRATDVGELTRSVVAEVGAAARDKRQRLSIDGADAVSPVVADPQLLRQVLLNLVANAIKYTPPGGAIAIRMARQNGELRWAVRDDGIGVPKDAQRRLFEKFYRAENAQALDPEGTGLGLCLARVIVERLGGRVWCESEEGRGATFSVSLPA